MSNKAIQAPDLGVALCESLTKSPPAKISFCVRISRCMYVCMYARKKAAEPAAGRCDCFSSGGKLPQCYPGVGVSQTALRAILTAHLEDGVPAKGKSVCQCNFTALSSLQCLTCLIANPHVCVCQHSQHIHVYYRSSAMVMLSGQVDTCTCLD